MLQHSKLLQARKEWRDKAIQRGYQVREYRKKENVHLARIAELKQSNRELKQTIENKKKPTTPPRYCRDNKNTPNS